MESSFGRRIITTISGGSHEPSVKVSITGLPEDFTPDASVLQDFLDRRSPGNSPLASSRKEADIPVCIGDSKDASGRRVLEYEIRNTDYRSSDYEKYRYIPRPGHADYTARLRYGSDLNMNGGGPFSGRMTAPLCIAGGLALQLLEKRGITVSARLVSAGGSSDIENTLAQAADLGDSVGGIVQCVAEGVPAGIGDAMYGGMESRLADILFGIPAVKGVDFGSGFAAANMKGSENNDAFYYEGSEIPNASDSVIPSAPNSDSCTYMLKTETNNCGGILGGITDGMPLSLRVAFKPTPSIAIPQKSVDLRTGTSVEISVTGRHDPCVALRAVPAVEAAVALGILDAIADVEAEANADSSEYTTEYTTEHALDNARKEIDEIDGRILELFTRRMQVAEKIGAIKREQGIPVTNASREDEIIQRISGAVCPDFAPYAEDLFKMLFSLSKRRQSELPHAGEFGLIGHPLPHSFSKEVHEAFGEYSYSLFDLDLSEMSDFLKARNFRGLSVTRPYKQDVMAFCDRLTDRAKAIGAVNTLYWDGPELVGHNTDYDGFLYTSRRSGIDFAKKTVLILGTGGTSKTVEYSVRSEGARRVYFASRRFSDNPKVLTYDNLKNVADEVDVIVNTTPVGMYPNNGERLISLKDFPSCEAVIDVIYNPTRTPLLIEAEALGLKWANGMPMIVAQAAAACELFMGKQHCASLTGRIEDVLKLICSSKENIVLIGMPGCGKTTVGRRLAELTDRQFADTDQEIATAYNKCGAAEIISEHGEEYFLPLESEDIARLGSEHGQIIATGGGTVLTDANYQALKQNGTLVWLTRPVEELPVEGRPLSQSSEHLHALAHQRYPLYREWADYTIDSSLLLLLMDLLR